MNRLNALRKVTGLNQASIKDFNKAFNVDFLRLPSDEFEAFVEVIRLDDAFRSQCLNNAA